MFWWRQSGNGHNGPITDPAEALASPNPHGWHRQWAGGSGELRRGDRGRGRHDDRSGMESLDDMPDGFAYIVAKAIDEQQQLLQSRHLNFSYNVHMVWNGWSATSPPARRP